MLVERPLLSMRRCCPAEEEEEEEEGVSSCWVLSPVRYSWTLLVKASIRMSMALLQLVQVEALVWSHSEEGGGGGGRGEGGEGRGGRGEGGGGGRGEGGMIVMYANYTCVFLYMYSDLIPCECIKCTPLSLPGRIVHWGSKYSTYVTCTYMYMHAGHSRAN